jgi:hypothetical protein
VSSAPGTTAISNLVYENLTGAIKATTANASVQVCAVGKGTDSSTHATLCDSFGPSHTYTSVTVDPEAPTFALNRVTVVYTVTPLIPGTVFGVAMPTNMTFTRQVSMRSLY